MPVVSKVQEKYPEYMNTVDGKVDDDLMALSGADLSDKAISVLAAPDSTVQVDPEARPPLPLFADLEGRPADVVGAGLVPERMIALLCAAGACCAASAAGDHGWVRNLPDRRVEAVLQGGRAAVESVVDFMRSGPPGSAVIDCVVSWRPPGERFHGFDIRY